MKNVIFCVRISQSTVVACDSLTGSLTVECMRVCLYVCMFVVPREVTKYLKHNASCYNI